MQDYDVNTCKTRLVMSVSGNRQTIFVLSEAFIFIKNNQRILYLFKKYSLFK